MPLKKRSLKRRFKNWFHDLNYKSNETDEKNWIIAQGPECPGLIDFIKEHEAEYESFIFFAYLYYPTVFGIEVNPKKSIFVPLAHDEWVIRIPIFKKIFNIPASIMYNTLSEKRLANRLFHNEAIHSEIAGTWVDIPPNLAEVDVKTTLNINTDYILYVGRVDVNKITHDDFNLFLKYVKETGKNIKMVLIGNRYMEIPVSEHIMYLGFVDEETKYNLISNCLFLYQPSRFESLSHVVLEAFAMQKPVLVHKDCEVMRDHIEISHGGFYYHNYKEYREAFDQLVNNKSLNEKMGKAGKIYVDDNYRWKSIVDKFCYVIENKMSV